MDPEADGWNVAVHEPDIEAFDLYSKYAHRDQMPQLVHNDTQLNEC